MNNHILSRIRLQPNLQSQLLPLLHLIARTISFQRTQHSINHSDYINNNQQIQYRIKQEG